MNYTVLDSIRNQNEDVLRTQFALDVLIGFCAPQKFLPSMYFYDRKGSELFERITELGEYYPTDCEFEILTTHGERIASMFADSPFDLVELGAGDGRKTKVLLSCLQHQNAEFSYIPVDISEAAIANLVGSLERSHPRLVTAGLVGEYFDSIHYLEQHSSRNKLVLFLGSNIGNFDYLEAMRFLRTIWKHLNEGDYLLVGFDLKKDIDVLTRAYNDCKGVTRDFNLNVLRRINDELDAQFELDNFAHHGFYNPLRGAMESHLVSTREQHVPIGALSKTFHFKAYESIHLEYSYKYLIENVEDMATNAGFEIVEHWQDSRAWFVDSLWRVIKNA